MPKSDMALLVALDAEASPKLRLGLARAYAPPMSLEDFDDHNDLILKLFQGDVECAPVEAARNKATD